MTQTEIRPPRIHADRHTMVPRILVRAMAGMCVAALLIVTYARLTDRPLEAVPPVSPVKAERLLHLSSEMSGAVTVLDETGTLLARLAPEQGGFIAGVHRVILHERGKARLPDDGPVLLQAYENGRMALIDPVTGWRADLMGFGADNAGAFAKLLATR
ncbi:photosynthetic complex assembly protein PuhC [Pseudoponticoccus marisrubri]|uniref:Pullulanase n=1 Tax=Pseudoponticoccus marisrubri TaxID=1685382 RepID=A0A0W7WHG7_9RHOB|nr:photosynthetic complex assembly protein PuhC [Pseudoponticoccus marisrubri]KUF10029.1 hypothetical protein AVJ23_14905 [Pseudoponticoccus marisrubri]